MESPTDRFIRILTKERKVVVIGGLAVIAHGLSRSTYDGDIWLAPGSNCEEWAVFLENACMEFGNLTIHRLPGWLPVAGRNLVNAVEETGMVRIMGLDCPLDVFRKPNEIEIEEFEGIVARGRLRADGTILPDPLDLIQSKLDTGRDKDLNDIQHLESVVRADYKRRLPTATFEEAAQLLESFSEWQVLEFALKNPSPEVHELAMAHLREFAEAGDPFSKAILEGRELP